MATLGITNPVTRLLETPVGQDASALLRKGKRSVKNWRLRQKRARAAKKKGGRSKTLYLLLTTLFLLFATFAWALDYLDPDVVGRKLRVDELSALADQYRIENISFHDEDALIVGTYAAPAPETVEESTEPAADKSKNGKASDKTSGQKVDAKKADAKKPEGAAGDESSSTDPQEEPQLPSQSLGLPPTPAEIAPTGDGAFWMPYPQSDVLTQTLVSMSLASGAEVDVDPQKVKGTVRLITTFLLPLMILANLFAVLFSASKGGGSGIGDVITFGSMGKRRYKKGQAAPITFGQVAGADEAVAELKEVVDYLKDPERYEDIGATPPKGVLLFGPPGCGKTLLAKAVAGEAGVPFFSVAGAEFVESLVGVGAARVRDLFQRVRAVAPAIVFIDELDAAARKRGSGGGGGGSDEREQTLNQMLVEMDGFEVSSGIVVIGATNRPDILDPAILRPGRFDRHITVEQPDMVGRQQILELHAAGKPVSPMVDFNYVARRTPGFSGADLANVVNEAALLTLREGKPEIEITELEEAIQRVLAGPKKRGRVLSPEERKRASYHESGHAIVAAATGRLEEVHRVSILQRGRGMGMASIQKDTDQLLLTRTQLFSQLATAMGGLAAEELAFGERSTGAEMDLEQATEVARDIVGRYGMGKRLRRLLAKEADAFLGSEAMVGQISGQTHHEMDEEIDRLLEDAREEAQELLIKHRHVLDALANRLETEETLEGADLETVLAMVRPEVTLFGSILEEPHIEPPDEDDPVSGNGFSSTSAGRV